MLLRVDATPFVDRIVRVGEVVKELDAFSHGFPP